jgi:gas vesicle protein
MSNGFLKGALIGGVAAGIAGLLLAPKSGSKLIKDILDTYDFAQKNGHDFIEAVKEKSASITRSIDEGESESHSSLLIGIALGAVVSGIAALLLAPSSGKKMRRLLGDQYDDIREKAEDFVSSVGERGEKVINGVNDWKETLTDLVNKLSHNGSHGRHAHSNGDRVVSLAKLGLNLYQQLQSRR